MKRFETLLHLLYRMPLRVTRPALLCLLCLQVVVTVYGQPFNGPGGVDPTLCELWLKPENLSGTSWTSTVTGSFPYTITATGISAQPNLFNFNHGLNVNDNSDQIDITPLPPALDFEIFIVFNTTDFEFSQGHFRDEDNLISAERSGVTNDYGLTIVEGRPFWYTSGATNNPVIAPNNIPAHRVDNGNSQMAAIARTNTGFANLQLAGASIGTNTGTPGNVNASLKLELFGGSDDNGGNMRGELAEFIFFSRNLSVAERRQVHSYLAIKYGITQTGLYLNSSGATVYDPSGGFSNEIVGIMRDDNIAGNPFHQRISTSSTVNNGFVVCSGSGFTGGLPNNNDNGNTNDIALSDQSLIIGHNAGSPTMNTTYLGIPNARMGRVFKAQNTLDIGMVTLYFDDGVYTGMGAGGDYSLVLSSDVNIDIDDNYYPMIENTFNANSYRCELDFPPGTWYFSIVRGRKYAPGGVGVELAAWYRGDSAVSTSAGNITGWNDASGRGRHMTNSPASSVYNTSGALNFNSYLDLAALYKNFGTANNASGDVAGRTLFFVGNLTGGSATDDGILGFENDPGMRFVGSGAISNPATTGAPEFQSSGSATGMLRSNATAYGGGSNSPFNASWSVVSAFRGNNANGAERFWLGGFDNNATDASPPDLNISEVVIYSGDVTNAASLQKIESYLAIKYGITLANTVGDYYNSAYTSIYSVAGNSANITVIGRDDVSRLNQKQSHSVNNTATVTLGIKGQIAATNAANGATFTNDRSFLAVGDNSGDDCWTNQELDMGTRQYLRIPREWRMQRTGSLDSVKIRISSTATNFTLPTLPTGATNYYLLVDTDGDGNFATGLPTAHMMTLAGSDYEATLTDAEIPGFGYFTIGTALPPSYRTLQPCVGDTVELMGYNLVESSVCILFSGGPAYGPISNVSVDSFLVATNAPAGCLDVVEWVVPASFTGDHYLTVQPGCAGPTDTRLLNDSLWAGLPLTPDIAINGIDTAYLCLGDPNVSITNNNGPGGVLSLYTYPSTPPIVLPSLMDTAAFRASSLTDIFVHAGNVGHHAVIYRYPSGCSSSDTVHVFITPSTTAALSYGTTTACQNDTVDLVAVTTPLVATGGSFGVIGVGLNIDSLSGLIQADISQPGNYLVTFNPDPRTCALPKTVLVAVQAPASAMFNYPDDMCEGAAPLLPTITTYTPGVFATTSTVNTTLNSLTGALNFVPTAVSPHVVYFLPTAACRDTIFDTINIVTPVAPVFVAPGNACLLQPFEVMTGTPGGGVFSTSNPSLVISNDTILISSSLPGGPYPITYTVTDIYGCEASLTDNFSIINLDTPRVQYPRPGYCQNEGPQAPVFGATQVTAGIFSATVLNGAPLGSGIDTDGTLHPGSIAPGTYQILFAYTNGACNTPIPVDTIIISPAPSAFFTVDSLACESDLYLDLDTTGGGNLGTLELFAGGQVVPNGSALFQASPDRINFTIGGIQLDTNTTYFIQNIYTNVLGCTDTMSASFLIQPDQSSNFAYLSSLYCANTSNPTPFIYGVGGGFFSCPLLDTTQLDSATGLLNLISAFTDPDSNQVDNFLITYTSPGPCPTSSTDSVSIREGFDSYFQFPVSITCSSRDTIIPTDVATTNPAVSRFGQLFIHPNNPLLAIGPPVTLDLFTGVITDLASLNIPFGADTSLYFYHETGASGLCIERTVQRLQVSRFDPDFNIDYSPDTVCGDHILQASLGGDVSEAYMNNPIGVTYASSGLGDIDGRFSQPGPHIIVMSNRAICGERDSTNIFILSTPNASFEYNAPNICTGDSTFEPLPLATPNGVFSYDAVQSFDDLNLDSLTGVVTVAGSDPGNYWVYYEATSNDGCVAVDSQLITISLSPQIDSLRANPGNSVCRNTGVTFTCFSSGGTVGWFIDTLDTRRTGPTTTFDSLFNGQTVRAVLRSTAGCTDTASLQMEVLAPPSITVLDRPLVVVEADPFQIQLESNQDNTIILWHAEAIGLEIDSTDGQKGVLNVFDRTTLTNGIRLLSDYDPGEINYVFIPITNGCIGDSLEITIEVNPNALDVFIPEVMTPDGNGANDTWEIRYENNKVTASDYYIEVFNRAGGRVKTLVDLDEIWGGTSDSGQPLGDGVYWWLLKRRTGEIEQGGGLTIRRH